MISSRCPGFVKETTAPQCRTMYRAEKKDTFLLPGLCIPEMLFKLSKAYLASLGMFNVFPGFLGRLHFLSGLKKCHKRDNK